jgi:hypothetical protein
MLIGTRVPPNLRRSLDHHGIAWKEITPTDLLSYLHGKCDADLLSIFEEAAPLASTVVHSRQIAQRNQGPAGQTRELGIGSEAPGTQQKGFEESLDEGRNSAEFQNRLAENQAITDSASSQPVLSLPNTPASTLTHCRPRLEASLQRHRPVVRGSTLLAHLTPPRVAAGIRPDPSPEPRWLAGPQHPKVAPR